ncbi:MAG: amino acid ABC transporter substrate-binding protein [Erysipelotrichia bacterium]|nr:amino acid ABC transporter substrate-binding protein [Erysipelotrichia bacterium]
MTGPGPLQKLKNFMSRFDSFQLLSLPLLFLIVTSSIDFKPAEMVIGVVLPLTGEYSSRAANHKNGLVLAATHINNLGGIGSRKIRLEICDSMSSPERTAEITRDLIYDTGATAIIGGFSPANTRIIQHLAEKAQVPFLTGICTHFETTSGGANYTFRSVTDDQRQFEALAEYSTKRFNSKKPALIYDTDLYGPDSAQKYIETCTKFGQQVSAAVSYRKGALNFRKQIDTVLATNPDSLIILAPPADSAMIVRQAREARFAHLILGANQMASPEFIDLAGVYSGSVITTLPFNARLGGQRADFFLTEYFDHYSTQADADAALGYESLMVMAQALKSGNTDRQAVRNALAQLHGWEGVTGSGGFDNTGNQVKPAEIAIIKDRQSIPVNLEELF